MSSPAHICGAEPSRLRGQKALSERRIVASRNSFWKPADIPGSRSAVQHLLADLVRRGELMRVRRGLYWRGVATPLGMSPPPSEALARELAGDVGVGLAGLSAANVLRLSTQVPRRAQIAVPDRAPSDSGSIEFVSRAARNARVTAKLNAREVAFLEVLDGWHSVIELPLPVAWHRLVKLVQESDVRAANLAQAGVTEPGPVRARLHRLLVDANRADLAQRLPQCDPRNVQALERALSEAV